MGIEDKTVVALTWLLSHPLKFIPLLGTTNLEHLRTQVRCSVGMLMAAHADHVVGGRAYIVLRVIG